MPLPDLQARNPTRAVLRDMVEAVKGTRDRWESGDPDAAYALRRLARRILGGLVHDHGDLTLAARRVVQPEADLRASVAELLAELRRATASASPDRSVLIVSAIGETRSLLEYLAGRHARAVATATTAREARVHLSGHPVTLVVVDVRLDDGDGRDLLAELAQDPTLHDVPILAVLPHHDASVRAECLALGAAEVFARPLVPAAMDDAIASALGIETRMTLAVAGDLTTGLGDSEVLESAAHQAQERFFRTRRTWCLAFARPDGIEDIATRHGRRASEAAISLVAQRLQERFPAPAVVCRWREHDLAVLLPDCALEVAQAGFAAREGEPADLVPTLDEPVPLTFTVGGVEMGGGSPRRAVKVAQRMLALASRLGAGQTLLTRDDAATERPRVLVADDDPDVERVVGELLGQLHADVLFRHDGREALELARQQAFSLIVLDLQLPGMDGLSVLRHLRAAEASQRTPVMVLTALGDERQILKVFEAGADDYVVKPFQPLLLQARAKRLLHATHA